MSPKNILLGVVHAEHSDGFYKNARGNFDHATAVTFNTQNEIAAKLQSMLATVDGFLREENGSVFLVLDEPAMLPLGMDRAAVIKIAQQVKERVRGRLTVIIPGDPQPADDTL
ncbi:hypothetical protein KBD59_02680 [Candidatus Gracilibacteria bacterium]|nr:hypothetical protein [Candidatus Gracilibacteria bacterium]